MQTGSPSKKADRALLAALVLAPLVVALLPLAALERAPDVCLLHNIGIRCWGCGMTRAVASAARGDFDRAWDYNPRVVVVAPLLALLWSRGVVVRYQRLRRVSDGNSGGVVVRE